MQIYLKNVTKPNFENTFFISIETNLKKSFNRLKYSELLGMLKMFKRKTDAVFNTKNEY